MLASLILASAGAGHAAAAHAPEHAQVIDTGDWLPAVTALVVFLVAFGILYWKVWPPIVKGLDARERKIRDEIAAAEAAREQAKAALAQYEQSLARAQEEANRIIAQTKANAKALGEELRTKNEAELTEMKQRATREIESAKQAAIDSLHAEASNLAVAIARKILQREINPRDQQALMEESVQELAKAR
jgi:F-type H+-transporting ATPase subunit b